MELVDEWREIERMARKNSAPCLLHRDIGLVERVMRDELTERVEEIVVDSREEYENITSFAGRFPSLPELSLYSGAAPIFDAYGVERAIEAARDRKVWLQSGAYLVIDQTEALTVIDVNTGKYIGSKDLQDTVRRTNFEAAEEIARQLRLRAIGGIIVVDFIDMASPDDRHKLAERLQELFKEDKCKARVYGVTSLGLVEITRKRARPDMRSVLSRSCPYCGGLGWVDKEDAVAMRIKRLLRRASANSRSEAFVVEAHPAIAAYVAETYMPLWAEELGSELYFVERPEYAWDKFRLEYQGDRAGAEHRALSKSRREAAAIVHSSASA
jgi:ribonuclease G